MTPDDRHEDVVRRYPGGLTPAQFRREVLASANADGELDPPATADWFAAQGLLMGMWMDGLIKLRRPGRNQPMWPWFITEKGRALLPRSDKGQG